MSDTQEPSTTNKTDFTDKICDEILIELDGWGLKNNEGVEVDTSEPFFDMSTEENEEDIEESEKNNTNKRVSRTEVEHFYYKALKEALNDTNRLNLDEFDEILTSFFIDAVIKLTASNLWIKYNTSVTVDNEEGLIDYGQGGKLYKKYKNSIRNFIKEELFGLSGL